MQSFPELRTKSYQFKDKVSRPKVTAFELETSQSFMSTFIRLLVRHTNFGDLHGALPQPLPP